MLAILDLDHTLLNTTRFKRLLEEGFEKLGIESAVFWETFGMIAGISDQSTYSIERHAHVLHEQSGVAAEAAQAALEEIFDSLPVLLYPDSRPFLEFLQEKHIYTSLLTFGNAAFQEQKVRRAGIFDLFADTIFTEESKDAIVLDLSAPESDWVFINDNPNEIRALAARYPEATMLRIRRHDGKKFPPEEDVLDVPTFETLSETQEHLGL